jgi:hypothetical protein
MQLLAVAAACFAAMRTGPRRPAWLTIVSVATALSLAVSGIAYLLLQAGLAQSVYLSGLLLLIWVAGSGLWASAQAREYGRPVR